MQRPTPVPAAPLSADACGLDGLRPTPPHRHKEEQSALGEPSGVRPLPRFRLPRHAPKGRPVRQRGLRRHPEAEPLVVREVMRRGRIEEGGQADSVDVRKHVVDEHTA